MRRCHAFLLLQFAGLIMLGVCLAAGERLPWIERRQGQERGRALVRELGLTDLCLFTEARYTRHPSQADLHSAFQNHPAALDQFTSGALVQPPTGLWAEHHALD